MKAIISPSVLSGKIDSISSKSYAHRILICASLCNQKTEIGIQTNQLSQDINATIKCLESLGAKFKINKNSIVVTPISSLPNTATLNCFESGSTLRFLMPVVSALGVNITTFTGEGKLPLRPIDTIVNELQKHGVSFSNNCLPLEMRGKLNSNNLEINGDISSQYLTGTLLALPLIGGGKVKLTSPLKSKSYIDITCKVLKEFGIDVEFINNEYVINAPNGFKSPQTINVQGDWSNSAFFLCCGALSKPITLTGLDINSSQGDKEILNILKQYGSDISIKDDEITVTPNNKNALNIDANDIPDLVPIISVLASVANGKSIIKNIDRLRYKESDRIKSTLDMINALGGNAKYEDNNIIINGKPQLNGGTVNGYNDHRIVMSASIASCVCKTKVTITDANAVEKSYPNFYTDFNSLGGKANVV